MHRSASDADLRRTATELVRRFPSIPTNTTSSSRPPNGEANDSTAAILQSQKRRSHGHKSTSKQPDIAGAGAYVSSIVAQRGNSSTGASGGASSVPLAERSAAGSPVMSLRPQVLRRMQRLNDDAEFIVAFEKETNQMHEDQRRKLEEKQRRQAAVKRDMEEAEGVRLARLQAEKDERDRQREVVNAMIEEARLAEIDEKMAKKKNIQKERRTIQEQNRIKEQLREDAKRRDCEENERLKAYAWQQERNKLLQEIEKNTRSKSAMMSALEEGKTAAIEREEMRRQHRQESSPMFSTRSKGGDDRYQVKCKQREFLQSIACQHYEDIQQVKKHDLEKLDHLSMEAHIKQLKKQEERERNDQEKSIRMRAALVSSLDEELSAQRDRKRREDEEKKELRRIADAEAEEVEIQRRNAARKEKREQERRRLQMDQQLAARLERMTQPISVKI